MYSIYSNAMYGMSMCVINFLFSDLNESWRTLLFVSVGFVTIHVNVRQRFHNFFCQHFPWSTPWDFKLIFKYIYIYFNIYFDCFYFKMNIIHNCVIWAKKKNCNYCHILRLWLKLQYDISIWKSHIATAKTSRHKEQKY